MPRPRRIARRYIQAQSVYDKADELSERYGVDLVVSSRGDDHAVLSKIVVPEDKRGQGIGSRVLEDLTDWADRHNIVLGATPSDAYGGDVGDLERFYRSFGFVDNDGEHKTYHLQETMVRYPEGSKMASDGDITYEIDSMGWGLTVEVFDDDDRIGYLDLAPQSYDQLDWECREVYDRLPLDEPDIFAIEETSIQRDYRGRGIGSEMYVRAAEAAAERGAVMVAGECSQDLPVGTSEDAWRVWRGRTFQSEVDVYDEMIAWGG